MMKYNAVHDENDDDDACLHTMQYATGALGSMTVNAAMELGVFGIIGKAGKAGPKIQLSAAEIASGLLKKSPDTAFGLDRMLRVLVTHKFLTCGLRSLDNGSVERVYGLAPASKFLVGSESEGSLGSMVALANHPAFTDNWANMKEAIVEGGSDHYKKIKGGSVFEYMRSDPKFNETYNSAMAGISTLVMSKILKVYDGFHGHSSVLDVGGGEGKILSMVVSKYPSIKGINFDLPHVIQSAPLVPGVEHVEGDMFASIPSADAILMKDVLHNWSDEHCIKILKNCYEALPENGKVITITMIPLEAPDWSLSSRYIAGIDYIMLLHYSGRERSEKELQTLCMASGFSQLEVTCSVYGGAWSVVEFHK